MLDSLETERTDIHDLAVDAPLRGPSVEERYEGLKETPFYDVEHEEWQMLPRLTKREPQTQLLSVLVEASFDPGMARERYERMRPEFFSTRWQLWHPKGDPDAGCGPSTFFFDMLVRERLVGESPRAAFETLRKTDFLQGDRWAQENTPNGTRLAFYTADQLLATAVEARFDPGSAVARLNALRDTCLDRTSGRWIYWQHKDALDIISAWPALAELLVLVTISPAEAQHLWNRLDRTLLFDARRGLWVGHLIAGDDHGPMTFDANVQLLALLVESMLPSAVSRMPDGPGMPIPLLFQ